MKLCLYHSTSAEKVKRKSAYFFAKAHNFPPKEVILMPQKPKSILLTAAAGEGEPLGALSPEMQTALARVLYTELYRGKARLDIRDPGGGEMPGEGAYILEKGTWHAVSPETGAEG